MILPQVCTDLMHGVPAVCYIVSGQAWQHHAALLLLIVLWDACISLRGIMLCLPSQRPCCMALDHFPEDASALHVADFCIANMQAAMYPVNMMQMTFKEESAMAGLQAILDASRGASTACHYSDERSFEIAAKRTLVRSLRCLLGIVR